MSTFETEQPRRSGLANTAMVTGLAGICCAVIVISLTFASMSEADAGRYPTADQLALTLVSWLMNLLALGFGTMALAFGAVVSAQERRSGGTSPFSAKLGLVLGIAAIALFVINLALGLAGALWEFNQASERFRDWPKL